MSTFISKMSEPPEDYQLLQNSGRLHIVIGHPICELFGAGADTHDGILNVEFHAVHFNEYQISGEVAQGWINYGDRRPRCCGLKVACCPGRGRPRQHEFVLVS